MLLISAWVQSGKVRSYAIDSHLSFVLCFLSSFLLYCTVLYCIFLSFVVLYCTVLYLFWQVQPCRAMSACEYGIEPRSLPVRHQGHRADAQGKYIYVSTELGRNPVSKHKIQLSRLTRDGTAEPVSGDQILRRERGQGNIHFPCSAYHVQDWQPYPVDPCS